MRIQFYQNQINGNLAMLNYVGCCMYLAVCKLNVQSVNGFEMFKHNVPKTLNPTLSLT